MWVIRRMGSPNSHVPRERLRMLLPNYHRPASDASQLQARLAWQGIKASGLELEVALWGKNLLDDNAIVYSFDGCAFGGGSCSFRTSPRTYGIEVRAQY